MPTPKPTNRPVVRAAPGDKVLLPLDFGDRVQQQRGDLTWRDLAAASGVDHANLLRLCTKEASPRSRPRMDMAGVRGLAAALGVSPLWLLDREG